MCAGNRRKPAPQWAGERSENRLQSLSSSWFGPSVVLVSLLSLCFLLDGPSSPPRPLPRYSFHLSYHCSASASAHRIESTPRVTTIHSHPIERCPFLIIRTCH